MIVSNHIHGIVDYSYISSDIDAEEGPMCIVFIYDYAHLFISSENA